MKILEATELSPLLNSEEPIPQVNKGIKGHVQLLYRNSWFNEVNDSTKNPKLRLYKCLKTDYMVEPYLYINVPKYRVALSRLRLSSHHLGIEKGRHARPMIPVDQRLCTTCVNEIDDEIHFVTKCSKYSTLRKNLFSTVSTSVPSFCNMGEKEKFVTIMRSEDPHIMLSVAKFCYTAWKQQ